ncbi:MAG TPA: hypothetical protein PK028_01925 [Bacteroidales bacterium]|jgi:hypothetical protein|nr:hypothetical protein [Bacteroidales bacterium]MDI9574659.1 hypothetical protein [Bacteroidota bacterium]MBP9511171.1 hypothetical protein [Bacteroidales bacterium]MBP9588197.1 hypothetical protein [Bacteroidales bacterium]HNZ78804.1 hypothetical protein [Bacteroidales bacterium]
MWGRKLVFLFWNFPFFKQGWHNVLPDKNNLFKPLLVNKMEDMTGKTNRILVEILHKNERLCFVQSFTGQSSIETPPNRFSWKVISNI